ncbi:MAG: type 1 glutamine amidotransferase [Candidatus Caenarcaniphilales bacterium]|nr:type 1 glutamine amidotransferase [Candidatus Caenarcaniphilales bacterium]
MRIAILQHLPFESAGLILDWASEQGHELETLRLYEKTQFPSLETFDLLVILGGSMSVHDEEIYPCLRSEKEFIYRAIEGYKSVLGICLGAQLIAQALGANVYPASSKEIGWFPVKLLPEKEHSLLRDFPEIIMPLHWHGETFDLPRGSFRLAETCICSNQAFQYTDRVLGLQFHLEVSQESLNELVSECMHEIDSAKSFQQRSVRILSDSQSQISKLTELLFKLLKRFEEIHTS